MSFDGGGTQTHRYFYGTDVDQVLADENAQGRVLWALTDNQGTVKDLIDSAGVIQNHIVYDSFGKITNQTNSSVSTIFGYTGREYDAETEQYYYRARYYDQNVGRFINEDPLSFAAGDSNIYRYVNNSPINYVDPFGTAIQQADPNGEECVALNKKIENIIKKIATRKKELIDDFSNLPETCPTGALKDSREGHRQLIRDEEKNLEKRIKMYLDKCGGGSPPAIEGDRNNDIVVKALQGLAALGGGYLLYRGVRLLPSLLPPLWPTLGPNLAIP